MADFCPKCTRYKFSSNLKEKDELSPNPLANLESKCDYDIDPYRSAKGLKIGYYVSLCCEGCGLTEIEKVGKDLYNVTYSLSQKTQVESLSLEQVRVRFSSVKKSHSTKRLTSIRSLLKIWN